MEDYERARIASLIPHNDELRKLWQEHLAFEQRIGELARLPHLTPEEELERKELQKRKLAGKDRIAEILARVAVS